MSIVKAKLIKRKTDDGLIEIHDHIMLGKIYLVDNNTICLSEGYNTEKCISWIREIISTVDNGWLPVELLDISDS